MGAVELSRSIARSPVNATARTSAKPGVAAALGIGQGTVKSTVSRAVAKLRTDAGLPKR
jgi:hypothetical protein